MVSAVSATRRRAPGGSFIWPNTITVLSNTVVLSSMRACFISPIRSLPSRERSPTPANTEKPDCSLAMFAISSWITTVLPTPAPPKMPVLPPRVKGAIRSITLMPVSKTCAVVDCSAKEGAIWWIGRRSTASTGASVSIGSPSTLNTRPRVAGPTGTAIGRPVSIAASPRRRPSVVLMATALTMPPPRCCWTSATRRPPLSSVWISIAL